MTTEDRWFLQKASEEIKYLRKNNELMATRLKVYDDMMTLFGARQGRGESKSMGEDIVWGIEEHLRRNPELKGTTGQ